MTFENAQAEEKFVELLNRLRNLGPGTPPFEHSPVSPAQLALLGKVAATPGIGVQRIAEELGLTPPTVSVGVGRLEEAGLLKREPDPQDGRSIRLQLTSAGRRMHQRMQEAMRGRIQRLLKGLTPEEQETLLNLLEKAIRAAESA
jgi:DNA-binding MarR family transcriptional regulator